MIGSTDLVQSLIDADLVDELRLMIDPLLLGGGKRFFRDDGVLRPLEAELGRVRGPDRNAPRPIDLDIAFAGDLVVRDPALGLEIPDPEIIARAHLALPLADLAPEAVHPLDGRTLGAIAAGFADAPGVRVIGGPEALLGG